MNDLDVRPSKHERVMIELDLISQWAICYRRRVASALVTFDGVILISSRNGRPFHEPHCTPIDGDLSKRCFLCLHSEQNLLNIAARQGLKVEGLNLYTLLRPCISCANSIVQSRIGWVYFREDYPSDDYDYVTNLFFNAGIGLTKLEPTPQEFSFNIMLNIWRKTWTTTP